MNTLQAIICVLFVQNKHKLVVFGPNVRTLRFFPNTKRRIFVYVTWREVEVQSVRWIIFRKQMRTWSGVRWLSLIFFPLKSLCNPRLAPRFSFSCATIIYLKLWSVSSDGDRLLLVLFQVVLSLFSRCKHNFPSKFVLPNCIIQFAVRFYIKWAWVS